MIAFSDQQKAFTRTDNIRELPDTTTCTLYTLNLYSGCHQMPSDVQASVKPRKIRIRATPTRYQS